MRFQWSKTFSIFVALPILLGLISGAATQELGQRDSRIQTWDQWRGNARNGLVSGQAEWSGSLSDGSLTRNWQVKMGPSYSGPIVSESLVFSTETKDNKYEVVRAIDRESGKPVWEKSWEGAMSVPFFAKANGDWIRSTPAYDGESLYVAGMKDVLVCLNAENGDLRWQVDFVKELSTPVPEFGFVCSPLVDGEHVYVQAGAACCKLDKRTGKILWKTLDDGGGMYGSAFSSPVLAEIAGQQQLLVQTREKLAGVNPKNGEVLWSQVIPAFRGMNILTPTVNGDTVFTSTYQGNSVLFQISKKDGKQVATQSWTNRSKAYMSTPVVIDKHVYLHLQNQRFTCIDLATGETSWTTKPFGKYWSLVANGNKILALDERGELLLIRANPEKFELLDQMKVSDQPTWAHLAICENEVFVRELNALTSWRWGPAESGHPNSKKESDEQLNETE